MAIAQAVLEFLDGMRPRTLFATHYHELTGIAFRDVKNLNVEVAEYNNEIIFMHKIVPGIANRSYGIHVAQMAGMPSSVVKSAEQILSGLEKNEPIKNTPDLQGEPGTEKLSQVFIVRSKNKETNQLSLFGK